MKIYLSGKITGLPLDEAQRIFNQAEEFVKGQLGDIYPDIEVINPMKEVPFKEGFEREDYMAKDIMILLQCDAIYMLPGWQESKGARLEHKIAFEAKKALMFGGIGIN